MAPPSPVIRTRTQHSISRRDIDPDALKVLYRLARRGHVGYLVGGGVRDLLLGRRPKDFDVSTDARPRQLKSIFPNCFLIGRRFRLAHIRYGEKIIETSTFRRQPETEEDPENPDASLLQQDDNTFGSPEEDALRRDFTINGLFYDAEAGAVIDYVGGLDDLQAGLVRCIGDPDIRFREDPVRMIRAIRFASRLGFAIESETFAAIERHRSEIDKAAPPRLVEEIQRLFAFDSAAPAFRLLHETGFMGILLPELDEHLAGAESDARFWRLLGALDEGCGVLEETTPALRLAALFSDYVDAHPQKEKKDDTGRQDPAQHIRQVLSPLQQRLKLPRRIFDRMIRILAAQPRFEPGTRRRRGRSRFVRQGSFPESLAFREMVLRADGAGETEWEEWRSWQTLYQERLATLAESESEDDDADDERDGDTPTPKSRSRRRGGRGRRGRRGSRARKETRSSGKEDPDSKAKEEQKAGSLDESPSAQASASASASGDGESASGSSRRKRRRRKKKSDSSAETGSGSDKGASESKKGSPGKGRRSSGKQSETSADGDATIDTSQPVTAMSFYGQSTANENGAGDNGHHGRKSASGNSRRGKPESSDQDGTDPAGTKHKPAPNETAPLWMDEI